MAQPPSYTRGYSFSNFQTANPTTPLPGNKVDIELNNIRLTLDATLANLALIQRDDGRIANGSIGVSQMDGALISLGFERPSNWATATAYVVDSAIFQDNKLYICLIAHTSTVFATDLANQKWVETIDFTSLITDAEAAATAAEGFAADAQAAAASIIADLDDYLQKAGGTMTGNITLPGTGSTALHAATLGQAQSSIVAHATIVGGTADAIAATFAPAFGAYTAKMRFRFTASGANTITNPTVNVSALGAVTIKKSTGVALAVGDIPGSGYICDCVYNGTDVILLNPALASYEPLGEYSAVNDQTGTTYTLVLADKGKLLSGANAAAITWTVPPNSSVAFPLKSRIDWWQKGAGQITFAQGAGVTIRPANSYKARVQYSAGSLIKIGTDEWLLIGDVVA